MFPCTHLLELQLNDLFLKGISFVLSLHVGFLYAVLLGTETSRQVISQLQNSHQVLQPPASHETPASLEVVCTRKDQRLEMLLCPKSKHVPEREQYLSNEGVSGLIDSPQQPYNEASLTGKKTKSWGN